MTRNSKIYCLVLFYVLFITATSTEAKPECYDLLDEESKNLYDDCSNYINEYAAKKYSNYRLVEEVQRRSLRIYDRSIDVALHPNLKKKQPNGLEKYGPTLPVKYVILRGKEFYWMFPRKAYSELKLTQKHKDLQAELSLTRNDRNSGDESKDIEIVDKHTPNSDQPFVLTDIDERDMLIDSIINVLASRFSYKQKKLDKIKIALKNHGDHERLNVVLTEDIREEIVKDFENRREIKDQDTRKHNIEAREQRELISGAISGTRSPTSGGKRIQVKSNARVGIN